MAEITCFVDHGFTGKDFSRFFLKSPEFTVNFLKQFLLHRGGKKEDLADALADVLWDENLPPDEFMLAYASKARTWLGLKIGKASSFPQLKEPSRLLREFGSEEWYGPLARAGRMSQIYFRPFAIPHFVPAGDHAVRSKARWMVVAEVGPNWLSLSWDGFTSRQTEDSINGAQFDFWTKIPGAFQELESHLGGKWEHIPLNKIVLKDLWDSYADHPEYEWEHLRVRAEGAGFALNAKSARIVSELNTQGLRRFSDELVRSVISALDIGASESERLRAENAVLRTIIHELGTMSYEFALSKRGGTESPLFHGHCYFGLRPGLKTQDSLLHIKCYKSAGGDAGARDFLLGQIE